MNLKIEEIINACGGRILNDAATSKTVTSISIDSRKVKRDALFVCIVGENFDGHDFISKASENGAICVLTERQSQPTDMDIP
jgi:UDP-N-acetylmuramyl pentapeptide synthase